MLQSVPHRLSLRGLRQQAEAICNFFDPRFETDCFAQVQGSQ